MTYTLMIVGLTLVMAWLVVKLDRNPNLYQGDDIYPTWRDENET
jgi:hypothetical protein